MQQYPIMQPLANNSSRLRGVLTQLLHRTSSQLQETDSLFLPLNDYGISRACPKRPPSLHAVRMSPSCLEVTERGYSGDRNLIPIPHRTPVAATELLSAPSAISSPYRSAVATQSESSSHGLWT